ncbi:MULTISPECIES: AAA family ATPase [Corynebacterium]|uniref:Protein CR006 P-loop domain-containing protein n=1 Tax=Corynebacterium ramonii TaxID=3026968 RepID=A0ABN4EGS4_9CORY|nr:MULTISPECIES: AAA family ATPase [Corynebacterium]AIU32553.1 Hypothetical protein CulFRC11_0971 [Corynebacterium ramonii FRC0011]ESU58653.1 hypothetical protein D881_05930 [Corynebacterium ulcerans NCTC 12077]STC75941.1 Uncharacterized protein conserved in bacteria [Corynebacterium ulcerans]
MQDLAERLVGWADKQSDWQRDLLRRICEGEVLDFDSLENYANIVISDECSKNEDWISVPAPISNVVLEPLLTSHLTKTDSESAPVELRSIEHIANANHLAPGARLDFESNGLNIVAGSNGSGKSGYTRIIKQVAVSRAPSLVLSNVYEESGNPSAVISFKMGEAGEKAFTWMAASDSSREELRRIRVFDALSARMHLQAAAEVAYVPPELQALSRYAAALEKISNAVESKRTETSSKEPNLSELNRGAGVRIVAALGQKSAISLLEGLKGLTPEEEKRVKQLPGLISNLTQNSPAKLVSQATDRMHRIASLRGKIEALQKGLDANSSREMPELLKQRDAALKAVEDAAGMLARDPNIAPGTGNATWQRLWSAACAHSLDPENRDERMSDLQSCPLCQQDLEDDARKLFEKFETFVADEARKVLDRANANLKNETDRLTALMIPNAEDHIELVSSYDPDLSKKIESVLMSFRDARQSLLDREAIAEASYELSKPLNWADLSRSAREASKQLEQLEAQEKSKIDEFRTADSAAEAVGKLHEEFDRLSIQKRLFDNAETLRNEHDRQVLLQAIKKAKSACSTSSATRQNKVLSKEYVDKVCEQFKQETKVLGIDRVPVALNFRKASRGINYIQVILEDARDEPVADVLSEGEHRMTAIAGFFADLTESGDGSVLVFDDPVSSLDQDYRRYVARRLVIESAHRQVIVFSHDVIFVRELYEEHERFNKERTASGDSEIPALCYQHINRTVDGTGVLTEKGHWNSVKLKSKIGSVRARIQDAGPIYRAGDNEAYERESRDISGAIRECWEIFVEQELLGGVVTRFKRSVETQRLRYVTGISNEDIARVDLGMSKHSKEFRGHAAPEGDLSTPLTPDELRKEIDELDSFRKEIEQRRKKK